MNKLLKIALITITVLGIFLGAWSVLHNDIRFHTDIARDFLLVEDIVDNHHLTLIGPRSGGVPGVFHGPLWIYLNVPAYVVGHGNPVVVGWFWFILSVLSVLSVYMVAKKIFDKNTAILAMSAYSLTIVWSSNNLINPFGAVLLSPFFFLFFYKYVKFKRCRSLVIAVFILGLIIQFQMAFGVPLLILTFIYTLYYFKRYKIFSHLTAYLILVLPAASYILFDLRNHFLQFHAVVNYLTGKENSGKMDWFPLLSTRIRMIVMEGIGVVNNDFNFFNLVVAALLIYAFIRVFKIKSKFDKVPYFLFSYFYLGFWILTFAFKGVMWGYYFWPFLPLTFIMVASLGRVVDKKLVTVAFICVFAMNIYRGFSTISEDKSGDNGWWQANYTLAKDIYKEKEAQFGYYIFTPDQYGYSPRYAMHYLEKREPKIEVSPYIKEKVTYLIIAPPPDDRPDLNGEQWKKYQIHITKKPFKTWNYPNGYKIEKYILSKQEQEVSADPNLINSLILR